jgi:tRNA dimethylallyltransferase
MVKNQPIDMITVLGPTATGKTRFAVHLASSLKGAIISADSRQVYKGMDLGTGKDLNEFMVNGQSVPYYLIDIVEAGTKFNVFEYQKHFNQVYHQLKQTGTMPVLCGGTGMYIDAVLKGYELVKVPVNPILRQQLNEKPLTELTNILSGIKPLHNKSDIDTDKRAIRAIEIALHTKEYGKVESTWPSISTIIFGLHFERDELRLRITQRLKARLRQGMIDEAQALLNGGVSFEMLAYYGLEYKFMGMYLNHQISYNAMVEQLNTAIHQFAKRQVTWFRKMEREGYVIHWIDGRQTLDEQLKQAMAIIAKY